MHHRGTTLKTALWLAFLLAYSGGGARAGGWMTDVAAAQREAQQSNKPLLMHFHASWCGPCRQMDGETLNSPEVQWALGRDFVGVKVDTDRYEDLTKRFNVKSLPSDVIVAPNGRVLSHTIGFQNKRDYVGRLARVDANFKLDEKTRIASEGTEIADPPKSLGLRPVLPDKPQQADLSGNVDAKFVGLNGYSPIALYQRREWVKGKREYSTTREGVVYLFGSREEVAAFEAEPKKFAPQLIGCDPVVYLETERAIPGSTRFGAYFEGDLFLFVSSATRDQFKQEPQRYLKNEPRITVDQIEFRRGS